ncbi:MAG: DUF6465 family protein [Lachnospiraceae bacterium]|nr:DUF6465 family protein [Lachnospiraceae bacterium]
MKEAVKKETANAKATKQETVKKETVKKEAVKKEAVKKDAVKKEAVKKETTKKSPVKKEAAKKAVSVTSTIQFELEGKIYSEEQLMNSVKDIWVYDYMRELSELKTIDLYVKPEESKAYYVINGDILGSFYI